MKWVQTPIGLATPAGLVPYASYFVNTLEDLTYPQALALLTFPICFTKNVINLVQLWKASKILVGVDLAERAMAREQKSRKP